MSETAMSHRAQERVVEIRRSTQAYPQRVKNVDITLASV